MSVHNYNHMSLFGSRRIFDVGNILKLCFESVYLHRITWGKLFTLCKIGEKQLSSIRESQKTSGQKDRNFCGKLSKDGNRQSVQGKP